MRTLAAALLVAVAVAGCGSRETPASTLPGSVRGGPLTIAVGETAGFAMYTHCGVESTQFNGRTWDAVEPLYAPDRLGPPRGWGNPEQEGRLTLEAPDRAVFAARGERVVLLPAAPDRPPRLCQ